MLTYRLFTIVSLALCWNVQRAQPHFKLQLFSLTLVKDSTWVHSACIVCVYIYESVLTLSACYGSNSDPYGLVWWME